MDKGFIELIRANKWTVRVAVAVMILEFIGFKLLYPHANILLDSNYYIDAAYYNLNIDIWPTAYSKFLRLVSVFTHSDTVVVAIQFIAIEFAILYLYFTILYFMNPEKWARWFMLIVMIINPAILSISNYILSDTLFTAMTLIWFTLMIWVLCRPKRSQTYILAALLFFLFMLRYYAIFYPVITFAVILLAKLPWRIKIYSIGLATILILGFIWHTSNQYQKLLGKKEFSAFSGWQIASNALIMYRNFHDFSKDKPPDKLLPIHQFVTHQLDSFNHLKSRPDSVVTFFYMWNEFSPLRQYMAKKYKGDSSTPAFKRWASMGAEFKTYGQYLAMRHPWEYVKYYVWQGIQWFAVPTDEALGQYNNGRDSVSTEIEHWFDLKSRRVWSASKKIYTVSYFPVVTAVMNALTILSVIGYFLLGCYKNTTIDVTKTVILFAGYWLINFLFSIVSAPMMLRYQLSIMLFAMSFGSTIIDMIYQSDRKAEAEKSLESPIGPPIFPQEVSHPAP